MEMIMKNRLLANKIYHNIITNKCRVGFDTRFQRRLSSILLTVSTHGSWKWVLAQTCQVSMDDAILRLKRQLNLCIQYNCAM